jgi:hypothetical protein
MKLTQATYYALRLSFIQVRNKILKCLIKSGRVLLVLSTKAPLVEKHL